MPTTITIAPGYQFTKDSYDWKVIHFNWDDHLDAGVELIDEGVFTVTCVSHPDEDPPDLVLDEELLLTGNRKVQFRLAEGTPGRLYNVAHRVIMNTTPAQRRERSFLTLVREL